MRSRDSARRGPQPIANVLAELMARSGFARVQCTAEVEAAWRQAAPDAQAYSRVGSVRRGVLEIIVSHSAMIQELSFQKRTLLPAIVAALPDHGIRDLRFRLGAVD